MILLSGAPAPPCPGSLPCDRGGRHRGASGSEPFFLALELALVFIPVPAPMPGGPSTYGGKKAGPAPAGGGGAGAGAVGAAGADGVGGGDGGAPAVIAGAVKLVAVAAAGTSAGRTATGASAGGAAGGTAARLANAPNPPAAARGETAGSAASAATRVLDQIRRLPICAWKIEQLPADEPLNGLDRICPEKRDEILKIFDELEASGYPKRRLARVRIVVVFEAVDRAVRRIPIDAEALQ